MMILANSFSCGKILVVLDIAKFALTVIQWVAPVLLILWGSIDLIKSIIAGKEEEVKKNQKVLIKRLISAVIIFLIPIAVSLLLGLLGSDDWKCCWKQAKAQITVKEDDITKRENAANTCEQNDY